MKHIVIIGAGGAIGAEFVRQYAKSGAKVAAFIRDVGKAPVARCAKYAKNVQFYTIDYNDEQSIAQAAHISSKNHPIDLVIVANGILHDEKYKPERSISEVSADQFQHFFFVNTILPALIAKHFIPKLNKQSKSIFAALSARVGSISDNKLGGWYSYRASKAALNMIIKSASIEVARKNPNAIIIGLHPGTVDSNLSKPFHKNLSKNQLFTAETSVKKLILVLENLSNSKNGSLIGYDGNVIEF